MTRVNVFKKKSCVLPCALFAGAVGILTTGILLFRSKNKKTAEKIVEDMLQVM